MDKIMRGRVAQRKVRELPLAGRPYFDKFYRLMYPKLEHPEHD